MANSGDFGVAFDVSRETLNLMEAYVDLVIKWNRSINLISKSTVKDIWSRHIADSAQLFQLSDDTHPRVWLDIGSGGGLPGIVISILATTLQIPMTVHLVESDTRKCAFLRTVVRELGLGVEVIDSRIEEIPPLGADIISARAFSNLPTLLSLAERHGSPEVTCLFLKGQGYNAELTEARESWNMNIESLPSMTDSSARILKIRGISRASERRT